MNIKVYLTVVFTCLSCLTMSAQMNEKDSVVIANEDSCHTEKIQSAIDACLLLANAAKSKDKETILKAKKAMEECNMSFFGSLRNQNREEEKLEGHLVFNTAFADSLAEGKDPYKYADKIHQTDLHRGQMRPGEIFTKTCFVKAKGKSVYTFTSFGPQELAVVAEHGGRVTTRVHAVNQAKGINEWHNDTVDVTKGRNSRKTAFHLPNKPGTKVTLEIINCTNKGITVVVISN